VEATGLSKSDIARIAGTHRSQVSRWVSGDQRPSYDRTMRLAAHLRRGYPDLAEELIAATGYGPAGAEPESSIHPEVLAVIRKRYSPEQQRKAIEMLEELGSPSGPRAERESSEASGPGSERAG
jgi:transcriptional regulator with XRE-family HTH domain